MEKDGSEDSSPTKVTAGREIFVLLASGVVSIFRETDIMIHYPQMVDSQTAAMATPLSIRHIGDPINTSAASLSTFSGSQDEPARAVTEPTPSGSAAEPIDLERYRARALLCTRLRIIDLSSQQDQQRLATTFDELFIKQAPVTEFKTRITTMEAARMLIKHVDGHSDPRISRSQYLAVHSLLMAHPSHFLADSASHRRSQLFTRLSQHDIDVLHDVSEWTRARTLHPNIKAFVEHVGHARVIRKAWEQTEASKDRTGLPRAVTDVSPVPWTDPDKKIIHFLKMTLGSRREIQDDLYGSTAMHILKQVSAQTELRPNSFDPAAAVGAHNMEGLSSFIVGAGYDLQHALIVRFLEEIGAMAPWQNPAALDTNLRTAFDDDPGEHVRSTRKDIVKLNAEEDHKLRNPHPHTVFVIDSQGAFELDDGISVSPVDGDHVWVHVHVADPTAVMRPTDDVALRAAHRFTSIYFPDNRWSMLPSSLVDQGVGLGTSPQGEQRAMTFSAKICLRDGSVEEFDVGLTKLEHVQVTTYDKVDQLLQSSDEAPELRQLQKVLTMLAKRRYADHAFATEASSGISSIEIDPLPLPLPDSMPTTSIIWQGAATVRLTVPSFQGSLAASSDAEPASRGLTATEIVGEAMILAGRVAGKFGMEHDIPLPYRGQLAPTVAQGRDRLLSMPRGPMGEISYATLSAAQVALPPAFTSTAPLGHFSMGITMPGDDHSQSSTDALTGGGYSRATSPLRRFPDLLVHWQLRSYLTFGTTRQRPWSRAALSTLCPTFDMAGSQSKTIMSNASNYWIMYRLAEILRSPEAAAADDRLSSYVLGLDDFAEGVEAIIALGDARLDPITMKHFVRIRLVDLQLPAECEWPHPEQAVRGSAIKVKIQGVVQAGIRNGLFCRLA